MINSNSNKAELLKYIKEETVPLDKYNKLQEKLEMKNKVIEGVQKQVEEKNKVINSLEDAIKLKDKETKGMQERFNKEKQTLLDETNKYIKEQISMANAQANANIAQGEYTKGLLVSSFDIISILKERANLDMKSIDKLIDIFKTSVIEITEKGDEL
jgi:hypothetical protein